MKLNEQKKNLRNPLNKLEAFASKFEIENN